MSRIDAIKASIHSSLARHEHVVRSSSMRAVSYAVSREAVSIAAV